MNDLSVASNQAVEKFDIRRLHGWTNDKAYEYLHRARWDDPQTQTCPHCGSTRKHRYRRHRKQYECKDCGRCFSLFTDTVFEDPKLSYLEILIIVAYFVCFPKGATIRTAAAVIGVTVKTMFQTFGKLRELLFHFRNLTPLKGHVHVDAGYFGGKPRQPCRKRYFTSAQARARLGGGGPTVYDYYDLKNRDKRIANSRAVMVLVQVDPEGNTERTIATILENGENQEECTAMVRRFVEPETLIWSDESNAYVRLSAWYRHQSVRHS